MLADKVILIVDDDPTLLDMYVERLKAENAIVLAAVNGDEALRMVADNQPHLILLDIMMPKTDGLEVLRKLKGDPNTKDIPVIILTAIADEKKKTEGLELGAEDYLVKTDFLPIDVIEKVRNLLNSHPGEEF